MKIEVLYFDGCPNYILAVGRIKEILKEEGLSAEVDEVNIREAAAAREVRFLGSPSIRVDGLDVEHAARSSRDYGMLCRTYLAGKRREGLPSHEMIRQAIRDAQSEERAGANGGARTKGGNLKTKPKRTVVLLAGSVLVAIVASFCCILPIVFVVAGVSIVGASALFAVWRPYLLGLTFCLLGLGFYFAYRSRKGRCPSNSVCAIPRAKQSSRLALWLAAGAVALFAAFPYYSGPVADFLLMHATVRAASQPIQPVTQHAMFAIEGMTCSACATAVESRLKAVPGPDRL